MGGHSYPSAPAAARVPDGVCGILETVRLVVDQNHVLGEALTALAAVERHLTALTPAALPAVLLLDIRDALRRGDAARDRVRPLVQRLTAVRP